MTKTTREGHWMSKELFDEVVEFIYQGVTGTKWPTSNYKKLLAKLDPPDPCPNFRDADICMECVEWSPCDSDNALGTCDNFEREVKEIYNECWKCQISSINCAKKYRENYEVCPNFKGILL